MAGILATGAAPAIVHAQATIRWRLASSFPKSLDTLFGVADVFAKKVSDMTGGKFTISTHAAGELMPAFGVVDGGRIQHPVEEVTIAGHLGEMFKQIVAVGADTYTSGGKTVGSMLIERMKVAGS